MTILATRMGCYRIFTAEKVTDILSKLKMPNESNPVRNIGKVQKFVVGTDFEANAE